MQDTLIAKYMVRSPYCITPEADLKQCLKALKEHKIRHLPVMQSKKLLGVVSERDIKAAANLPMADTLTVGDVMVRDVYVASNTDSLSDVAAEMAEHKYGCALIANSKGQLIGIFTTTDALRILADLGEEGTIESYLYAVEDFNNIPL